MSNFHTHEVVGRGSETRLRVGEKIYKTTYQQKGYWKYTIDSRIIIHVHDTISKTGPALLRH